VARKRDIDPLIWEHVSLGTRPRDARLLFIAMISNADDEGRLKGDPRYLKGVAFRYDEDVTVAQVRAWRDELHQNGHICVYEIGLDTFVHLPSWHRWQSINRLMISKIPPCPTHGPCPRHEALHEDDEFCDVSPHGAFSDYSLNGHGPLTHRATTTGTGTGIATGTDTVTGAGTGTGTGTGPGAAAAPPAEPAKSRGKPRSPQPEAPPPAEFAAFHGYLSGLKGYAATAPLWAFMRKLPADAIDFDIEAAKIIDYLGRHPNLNCSPRFLQTWFNRVVADLTGTKVNEGVARAKLGGARDAPKPGRFHRTCGTVHQGWEKCPADTGLPRVSQVPIRKPAAAPAGQQEAV
jgi:hypothetical protein